MKISRLSHCIALLFIVFNFSQCKKDKTEEAQLPPITTTGAMTFGCKVNGKVFVPRDGQGRSGLYCQYVNLGTGLGGGWFLNIPAIDQVPNNSIGINIVTDSLLVVENTQYQFGLGKGVAKARYYVGLDNYPKDISDTGSLFIIKHDQLNRILSGTFSFVGTNANGVKANVTDGRFDIRY